MLSSIHSRVEVVFFRGRPVCALPPALLTTTTSMSCAEISTSAGLSVYRELMGREQRSGLDWELNYGKDALMKTPDPQMMLNLGKFAKFSAVPLPLGSQLEALQRERNTQNASINRYEQQIFPFKSQVPVSELSVKYYGDDAWHSQPKTSGAPSSFVRAADQCVTRALPAPAAWRPRPTRPLP